MRLNRSLEELEKLRTVMHNRVRDDKELRDLTRKKDDEVAVAMKRLEKQKSELLFGFKKQMQLIDNLKKQKVSEMSMMRQELTICLRRQKITQKIMSQKSFILVAEVIFMNIPSFHSDI
jgi:hypothetical protein